MVSWWDKTAGELQQSVRAAEQELIEDYSDEKVRQQIVHTREDIVAIYSYMSSANKHLGAIKVLLLVAIAVLVYIAVRIS